ncbi:hypothetical protein BW261_25115 [Klebsiella aerogenes]|uniref:Uncharacterized protein n=1 Tax=Enterobacter cloacae TaxID=550 RepID=A0A4V1Q628_ENTCL|nr:hypothetical protein BW261_25115 [Klebsiella aerogenes]RXW27638.1 hypothetical protein DM877_18650 [Enterobacter cloacae]
MLGLSDLSNNFMVIVCNSLLADLATLQAVRFVPGADVAMLWCVNQAYGQEKCEKKKAANATPN